MNTQRFTLGSVEFLLQRKELRDHLNVLPVRGSALPGKNILLDITRKVLRAMLLNSAQRALVFKLMHRTFGTDNIWPNRPPVETGGYLKLYPFGMKPLK